MLLPYQVFSSGKVNHVLTLRRRIVTHRVMIVSTLLKRDSLNFYEVHMVSYLSKAHRLLTNTSQMVCTYTSLDILDIRASLHMFHHGNLPWTPGQRWVRVHTNSL